VEYLNEFVANLPVCLGKHLENRSTFREVLGKCSVSCFFDSRCSWSSTEVIFAVLEQ